MLRDNTSKASANPPFIDPDWFRKDFDVYAISISASTGERVEVRCPASVLR